MALAPLKALAQTSAATLCSEIARQYGAFHTAILSSNLTTVRPLLTDDFTSIAVEGKIRHQAEAAGVEHWPMAFWH
ncbi:MAG: hypothetical protein HYY24_21425 [Verrucomicrobia bacterium]|nr:hypothetical protein [Verrucomicrobiota bacterium]